VAPVAGGRHDDALRLVAGADDDPVVAFGRSSGGR
jgi:hypothetical protein